LKESIFCHCGLHVGVVALGGLSQTKVYGYVGIFHDLRELNGYGGQGGERSGLRELHRQLEDDSQGKQTPKNGHGWRVI